VAVISGLLAATYWIFIHFEGELLLDFWLVFFGTLLLLLFYRAKDTPRFFNWFLAGIVLGLFAITRPNILVLIPFILIWLWMQNETKWQSALKYWIWIGLGAVIVISPVTLRNYLVGHDIVLISSQGGINFFIGNNPYADGTSAVVPGLGDDWDYADAVVLAEQELGRKLKPSQASNYFFKRGWDFIFNQPDKSLPLLGKKFYLFWNKFEVSNNQNTYFFQRYSSLLRILPVGFWIIGPLSLLGVVLSLKNFRKYSLFLFYLFSYMLTVVFFFVADRFRLPVIPVLIIFSGFALVQLWERFISRRLGRLIFPLLLLAIFSWFSNTNPYALSTKNFAHSYFGLGNIFLKQNQLDQAKVYFDSALAENSNLPRAHLNLGIIYLRKGNLDGAGAEFAKTLLINPYEEKAHNNLSTVYRLKGDFHKAAQFARVAIQFRPNYANAYSNLSLSHQALNQIDSAELALTEGLRILPEEQQLHYYLGELFLHQQKFAEAEKEFRRVLEQTPEIELESYDISGFGQSQLLSQIKLRAQSAYYLGLIFVNRNNLFQAKEYFTLALNFKPDFTVAIANLGKISALQGDYSQAIRLYTKSINLDPKNPVYYYNRAVNYIALGQIDSAAGDLAKCLHLDPAFVPAKKLNQDLKNRDD
jgi:tetratricopeptide (TPR) repeat protein